MSPCNLQRPFDSLSPSGRTPYSADGGRLACALPRWSSLAWSQPLNSAMAARSLLAYDLARLYVMSSSATTAFHRPYDDYVCYLRTSRIVCGNRVINHKGSADT